MLHCSAPEVDSFIQLCSSRKYPYPLPTEGNGTSQGRGGGGGPKGDNFRLIWKPSVILLLIGASKQKLSLSSMIFYSRSAECFCHGLHDSLCNTIVVDTWINFRFSICCLVIQQATSEFPPGLRLKTRLSAQPLIWKWFFILMQIKLISTRKVVHLASFWKRGFLELGSGLLDCGIQCNVVTPSCFNKPSSNVLLTERNRRYWSSLVWEMTSLVSGACVVYGRTASMVLRLTVKN